MLNTMNRKIVSKRTNVQRKGIDAVCSNWRAKNQQQDKRSFTRHSSLGCTIRHVLLLLLLPLVLLHHSHVSRNLYPLAFVCFRVDVNATYLWLAHPREVSRRLTLFCSLYLSIYVCVSVCVFVCVCARASVCMWTWSFKYLYSTCMYC